MGLLLNAAPSGAEHIRRLRGVDAGQISGPVLKCARPKPGRRLKDTTETIAQVGREGCNALGGARADYTSGGSSSSDEDGGGEKGGQGNAAVIVIMEN